MFEKDKNEKTAPKAPPLPKAEKKTKGNDKAVLARKKETVMTKIKAMTEQLAVTEKKGEPTEKIRLQIRSLRAWESRFTNMLKPAA